MKTNFRSFLRLAALLGVGVLVLGLAPQAYGANNMILCVNDSPGATSCPVGDFVLLESDGTTITQSTGGTASVTTQATGTNPFHITMTASISSVFSLTVNTGTLRYAVNPLLDLAFQDTANGAGTLNIFWGGNGFTGFNGPFSASIGGTNNMSSTVATACIENVTVADPGSFTSCGLGSTLAIGSFSSGASSYSGNFGSGAMATVSPFGLLQQIRITSTGAGASSGDFSLNGQIPEPSSLLLLGGVLALASRAIKRRLHAA